MENSRCRVPRCIYVDVMIMIVQQVFGLLILSNSVEEASVE
jgi:hypothetical protein